MKFKDDESRDTYYTWKGKNTDPYGMAIFEYAERLCDLLEDKLEKGLSIDSQWKECCDVADIEGVTGFQWNYVKTVLDDLWIHGDLVKDFK